MQFCLPNKELWAKSAKYYLTVSPSNKQLLQFSVCRFALSWLGVILKEISIDWRSFGCLLYSTKEGEVSNKIDEFFASLINSIFSTRVVCGKGIL